MQALPTVVALSVGRSFANKSGLAVLVAPWAEMRRVSRCRDDETRGRVSRDVAVSPRCFLLLPLRLVGSIAEWVEKAIFADLLLFADDVAFWGLL